MGIFDYFRSKRTPTAVIAKERLQIIVAHERTGRGEPNYLAKMQQDIVNVIKRYVSISSEDVNVTLDQNEDCSVLELNVTLPDLEMQS